MGFFQEGLFKTNHLLYLLVSVLIVVGYIAANKKWKLTFDQNVTILVGIVVVNEIMKLFINMEMTALGGYYKTQNLPFHLCSFQVFLFIALKYFIRKETTREAVLGFMFPSLCIGAVMGILIPADGTSLTSLQVYRFFIYHAMLIGFGVYLVVFKQVEITVKVLLRNLKIVFSLAFVAIWLNSMLRYAGANFLYLARPPVAGLPFLTLDDGYWVYLARLTILALALMVLVHLPFIIITGRNKKKCSPVAGHQGR